MRGASLLISTLEAFQLVGKTPIGRATIDQLRMNSSYQIEARKYWVEVSLYP
jgi:hypothetical protein